MPSTRAQDTSNRSAQSGLPGRGTGSGTMRARTWVLLLLGLVAAALATVAAFNALVDPTAQLGTGVLEPVAQGPRDRTAKVELLDEAIEADQLALVTLGSSRSKKLDPAWLDGSNGVNAAVVGGDAFEARVLTAWIAERTSGQSDRFPQLVVGVDVEQLRDSSLQGSGFLDVPQLADVARREAAGSDGSLADELGRVGRLLLTWQVTKASAASVRARIRSGGTRADAAEVSSAPAAGTGTGTEAFTPAGVPVDDERWRVPRVARDRARATPGNIERNVDELRGTYDRVGATLDPDAVADLRAIVRIARDAGGPAPLLYVTPGHPALDELDDRGRDERHAAVRALLDDIAAGGRARVLDCATCIDDADTSWIDATHPSPLGMRQLAERLARELD